jgi:hypothetical protein
MLLLSQYHMKDWNFVFALINALVITKVIMIGEYAKLGRKPTCAVQPPPDRLSL